MTQKRENKINIEKLKTILLKKGMGLSEASIQMGYSRCTLAQGVRTGALSRPVMTAFCHLMGCTYDDIKADEPVEEPKQEQAQEQQQMALAQPMDPEAIRNVVWNAVFKGIGDALYSQKDSIYETIARACAEAVFNGIQQAVGRYKQEAMKDLRGAIYSAMYSANKQYQEDVKNAAVREGWK